jgi:serine/threonine protein kinase
VQMGQVEHIMQETQILSTISHPFVTNKYGAITTPSNLILIMEFCPGGDLFDQLYKHKSFSTADVAIFTQQVLLPLEYLHSLGIVHRDLKLENVLVAQDGALKLTDFGFAKYIKYRSWTLCGTPEYLAPELILEKGHGKAVDYWAFGVIFFEMLNGHSPFEAEDHLATYSKILDGTVNYPAGMDPDAVDIIGKLLQKDISRRYGNLKDGTADIKNHKYYTSRKFNWMDYAQRGSAFKLPPFDANKYEWVPASKYVVDEKRCKPEDQHNFDNF